VDFAGSPSEHGACARFGASKTLDRRSSVTELVAHIGGANCIQSSALIAGELDDDGRRLVVSDGRQGSISVTVGSGRCRSRHWFNDERTDLETGERLRISSKIRATPPLAAGARRAADALEAATFQPALRELIGEDARDCRPRRSQG
jgi:hypothetical protein